MTPLAKSAPRIPRLPDRWRRGRRSAASMRGLATGHKAVISAEVSILSRGQFLGLDGILTGRSCRVHPLLYSQSRLALKQLLKIVLQGNYIMVHWGPGAHLIRPSFSTFRRSSNLAVDRDSTKTSLRSLRLLIRALRPGRRRNTITLRR
jgi:hypothetical protein